MAKWNIAAINAVRAGDSELESNFIPVSNWIQISGKDWEK